MGLSPLSTLQAVDEVKVMVVGEEVSAGLADCGVGLWGACKRGQQNLGGGNK